jgi:hypothetical protein
MENLVTKTVKGRKVRNAKTVSDVKMVTDDAIRKRAFEIYLNNGSNSNAFDNWIKAEKELKESLK